MMALMMCMKGETIIISLFFGRGFLANWSFAVLSREWES
jgi:hypothetical protein